MNKFLCTVNKSIRSIAFFSIIFILISILLSNAIHGNWTMFTINIIGIFLGFSGNKLLKKMKTNISRKNVDILFVIGFVMFIIIQYLFVMIFKMHPSFDFAWIYNMAYQLTSGGTLSPEHIAYLYNYPFNYSLLVLYQFIFQNIAFNLDYLFYLGMICTSGSVLGLYFVFRNNFTAKTTFILSIITLTFYPYISYALVPYSDTIALPFVVAAILFIFKDKAIRTNYFAVILFGVAIMIGGQFKVLVLILAIAYFIYVAVQEKWRIKALALIPFFLYFVLNSIFGNYITSMNYSYAPYEKSGMTPLYWVYSGLNYDAHGRYNELDYNESLQWGIRLEDDEKKVVTDFYMNGIFSRLKMEPLKLFELMVCKTEVTWGNGQYGMNEYIILNPLHLGGTRQFFIDGFGKMLVDLFTQVVQMFLLVGVFISFKGRRQSLFLTLGFLGFFSYLLIFEAGPRYILLFSPILLLIIGENIDENDIIE